VRGGEAGRRKSAAGRPRRPTAREPGRLDADDTRVSRLRAWPRLTGWRFASSSAHREGPAQQGLLSLSWRSGRHLRVAWQRCWQHSVVLPARQVKPPSGAVGQAVYRDSRRPSDSPARAVAAQSVPFAARRPRGVTAGRPLSTLSCRCLLHTASISEMLAAPRSCCSSNPREAQACGGALLRRREPSRGRAPRSCRNVVRGYVKPGPATRLSSNAHVLMIRGLAVHPQSQGRGLGREAVATVVEARRPEARGGSHCASWQQMPRRGASTSRAASRSKACGTRSSASTAATSMTCSWQ
jgi:GNAT superfamily N-acetyltransferase